MLCTFCQGLEEESVYAVYIGNDVTHTPRKPR